MLHDEGVCLLGQPPATKPARVTWVLHDLRIEWEMQMYEVRHISLPCHRSRPRSWAVQLRR